MSVDDLFDLVHQVPDPGPDLLPFPLPVLPGWRGPSLGKETLEEGKVAVGAGFRLGGRDMPILPQLLDESRDLTDLLLQNLEILLGFEHDFIFRLNKTPLSSG